MELLGRTCFELDNLGGLMSDVSRASELGSASGGGGALGLPALMPRILLLG